MTTHKQLLTAAAAGLLLTGFPSAFAQNWTLTSAPDTNWISIASSADGSKLVAANDASVHVSTNAALSWTATGAPSLQWNAVASSADGTRLMAAVGGYGGIYASPDSGSTWTKSGAADTNWWIAVASSADGLRLLAAAPPGHFVPGEIAIRRTLEQLG